ncbi:MAG: hypothetical protein QOF59_3108, partial [Actinomycetota bacterium]|nr:hypothetical protein [Actinomycetota bacterium]
MRSDMDIETEFTPVGAVETVAGRLPGTRGAQSASRGSISVRRLWA